MTQLLKIPTNDQVQVTIIRAYDKYLQGWRTYKATMKFHSSLGDITITNYFSSLTEVQYWVDTNTEVKTDF